MDARLRNIHQLFDIQLPGHGRSRCLLDKNLLQIQYVKLMFFSLIEGWLPT